MATQEPPEPWPVFISTSFCGKILIALSNGLHLVNLVFVLVFLTTEHMPLLIFLCPDMNFPLSMILPVQHLRVLPATNAFQECSNSRLSSSVFLRKYMPIVQKIHSVSKHTLQGRNHVRNSRAIPAEEGFKESFTVQIDTG